MSGEQQQLTNPDDVAVDKQYELVVTYEVDGNVVKQYRRRVSREYVWYLRGNSSWREW